MSYSIEIERNVWNDKTGERIRIKPDGDSLGLLDVAYLDDKGEDCGSFTMTYDQARFVANVLHSFCDEKDAEDRE